MTSKEKAEKLIYKFKPFVQFKMGVEQSYVTKMAKLCASVAVDEILSFIDLKMQGWCDSDLVSYWQEVKSEIEKL